MILGFGKIAKQRYFLAPNISALNESIFTRGMAFHEFKMTTVFLETHEEYRNITGGKPEKVRKKTTIFKRLLDEGKEAGNVKTLVYAGSYPEVDRVAAVICEHQKTHSTELLDDFSDWVGVNYSPTWNLVDLIGRRYGIHNGSLHRSLAQIQVKLFDLDDGLAGLVSTSSIIEGVNTAAERVIVWNNKNGNPRLKSFDYKNLVGRGGRMFKYFVGHVHVLADPPESEDSQLSLDIPDSMLVSMDETQAENQLTSEQVAKIIAFKDELKELMSSEQMVKLLSSGFLQSSDYELAKKIITSLKAEPDYWTQLKNLNSDNTTRWDSVLFKVQGLKHLGPQHGKVVNATKVMSGSWENGLAGAIQSARNNDIKIGEFFKLERTVSFGLATVLHDINAINREVLGSSTDISNFVAKAAHAFLPVLVYQLEEYGLPRMISRKIQDSGIIDLEDSDKSVHEVIEQFKSVGYEGVSKVSNMERFDQFVLKFFFEGL